jgi:RNase P/RNase MRP subunit p29
MITPSNLIYNELICLNMRIARSSDRNLVGLSGRVVFETKNMLHFDSGVKICGAPKRVCDFEFILPSGQTVNVKGCTIEGRPEVRLSRLR